MFDPEQNFVHDEPCGCRVTFPASLKHLATHLKPCEKHAGHAHLVKHMESVRTAEAALKEAKDGSSATPAAAG